MHFWTQAKKSSHVRSKELEAACAAVDQAQQILEGGGRKGIEAEIAKVGRKEGIKKVK